MHPVPASKSALKALLAVRPAWSAVDIRDDQWTESEDVTRDAFWFEPTEIPQDAWASLGAQRRRVQFRLGFTIAVLREGDDGRSTEDAVWALLEDLLAVIKADPSLTQTVQQANDLTGRQANTPYSPGMWQATFTGSITCQSKAY